ncbi:hypothetical protein [Thiorhodococcus fuscus]|uniref:CHASE3 domain-containing protein n=1 Tax=Thiorhodococcus fuscus TaxID=527200 RepID=A0ABW4Y3M9_9GAMM
MSSISLSLLVPIGAVIAALVTGAFSLVNLILAKELKISDLRNEWINSFRDDVSLFIASISNLQQALKQYNANTRESGAPVGDFEFWKNTYSDHMEWQTSGNRILLRIQLASMQGSAVDGFLSEFNEIKSLLNDRNTQDANKHIPGLREYAREILQIEWNRVLKGEPLFILAKWLLFILTTLAIIGLSILWHSFKS